MAFITKKKLISGDKQSITRLVQCEYTAKFLVTIEWLDWDNEVSILGAKEGTMVRSFGAITLAHTAKYGFVSLDQAKLRFDEVILFFK